MRWKSARKLGCNALQFFSASPRMWQGGSARIPEVDAQAYFARGGTNCALGPLGSSTQITLSTWRLGQRMLQTRSIQAFHDEIVRAVALGADYFLVVAPGGTRGVEFATSDFHDCGVGQAGLQARADERIADTDREHRRNGNGSGRTAGRSGGDSGGGCETCRSERAWIRAPFCRGLRHQERRRAGFDDWPDRWRDRT